jgi:hypothetical protein
MGALSLIYRNLLNTRQLHRCADMDLDVCLPYLLDFTVFGEAVRERLS